MKVINLLFIICFFYSCSKNQETALDKIFDINFNKVVRDIASDDLECKTDEFNATHLKNEISKLEKKLEGKKKIEGKFQHIDLSTLPTIQATFLKTYGDTLGDKTISYDFSKCSDAICILNQIYNSTEEIEGLAVYYWYLKMGNILAVDNKVYDQAGWKDQAAGTQLGTNYQFKEFLFDKNELYGFWKISNLVSSTYSSLKKLSEIQRIPRKARLDKDSPFTCGLAYSTGKITLADGCLSFDEYPKLNRDNGYFYPAVIHEMSHQIDYHNARYSEKSEWMNEGQWKKVEIVDTSTGAISEDFETTLEDNKFISNYANTTPAEHFAETLAFYRHTPDKSKKTLPSTTYDLVKNKFYDQIDYNDELLSSKFLALIDQYDLDIFNETNFCIENPSVGPQGVIKLFSSIQNIQIKTCFNEVLINYLGKITKNYKRQFISGCSTIKNNKDKFDIYVAKKLEEKMSTHYQHYLKNSNYFNQFAEFFKLIDSPKIFMKYASACYESGTSEDCYKNKINQFLEENFPSDFTFKEITIAEMLPQIINKYPLSTMIKDALSLYEQLVVSNKLVIAQFATKNFSFCMQTPVSDQLSPISTPWSSTTQYVVSSLINCINKNVSSTISSIIDNFNSEILVKNEYEKNIFYTLVLPSYLDALTQFMNEQVLLENEKSVSYQTENSLLFVDQLKKDFSWVEKPRTPTSFLESCVKKILSLNTFAPQFGIKKEIFKTYHEEICSQVIATNEFKIYIESKKAPTPEEAKGIFKTMLEDKSKLVVSGCLESYPKKQGIIENINHTNRVNCFNSKWSYAEMDTYKVFVEKNPDTGIPPVELRRMIKELSNPIKEKALLEL